MQGKTAKGCNIIAGTLNQFKPKRSNLCSARVCPACLYIFQCIEELLPAQTVATEACGMRGCGNVASDWSIFDMQRAKSSSTFLVQPDLCGGCWGALQPSHWHCKTALASSLCLSLGATTMKTRNPCSLSNGQSAKFFIAFKPREKEQLLRAEKCPAGCFECLLCDGHPNIT